MAEFKWVILIFWFLFSCKQNYALSQEFKGVRKSTFSRIRVNIPTEMNSVLNRKWLTKRFSLNETRREIVHFENWHNQKLMNQKPKHRTRRYALAAFDNYQKETHSYKICEDGVSCLSNGSWSAWSQWSCSQTCGRGIGMRNRTCNNSEPASREKMCEGNATEFGNCDLKECPGKSINLSSEIISEVAQHMKQMLYSFVVKEGSAILLPCDQHLVNRIYVEYPNSETEWRKNEHSIKIDVFRIEMERENLAIFPVKKEDTGIYECRVIFGENSYIVVSVATVAVVGLKQVAIVNKPTAISCPLKLMTRYYPKLQRVVLLDSTIFSESYGTHITNEPFVIKKTTFKHSGTWWCGVLNEVDGRIWIVTATLLQVEYPVPFFKILMMNPWWIAALIFIVFFIFFVFGSYYTYYVTQGKDNANEDYEKLKIALAMEYGLLESRSKKLSDTLLKSGLQLVPIVQKINEKGTGKLRVDENTSSGENSDLELLKSKPKKSDKMIVVKPQNTLGVNDKGHNKRFQKNKNDQPTRKKENVDRRKYQKLPKFELDNEKVHWQRSAKTRHGVDQTWTSDVKDNVERRRVRKSPGKTLAEKPNRSKKRYRNDNIKLQKNYTETPRTKLNNNRDFGDDFFSEKSRLIEETEVVAPTKNVKNRQSGLWTQNYDGDDDDSADET